MTELLICDKCGNPWDYRGESQIRCTCPGCVKTVYIAKCRVAPEAWRDACLKRLEKEYEACRNRVLEKYATFVKEIPAQG